MLREFARRRGVGLTAAIKLAIREAEQKEKQGGEALLRKIEPILEQVREARQGRAFSAEEDKAFMDEMWGEEG
ncbi:MAG: type II toxin-antitoxin system VapB family antitoxin [Rhizobiaceae bacterium]|nr:type II toxin-antitoxin system VapB family antitoxin [Rhizobiaceae bacterium]